jgi:hypothetical protein
MAASVATPLERQIGQIAGVTQIELDEHARGNHDRDSIRSQSEHERFVSYNS